jgi:uracil-DNA glycosylase
MSDAAARLWAHVPHAWSTMLGTEVRHAPYLLPLAEFVERERAAEAAGGLAIFPPAAETFTALALCPPESVKVVILGQDPYFRAGQAHGLAFSVKEGVRVPPSLGNVFKEMHADIGLARPKSGSLLRWAERGVLLLNAVLTVRAGVPNSHARKGWEKLTSELLRKLSVLHAHPGIVFVLWGSAAQVKRDLIVHPEKEALVTHHAILAASHPSPRSVDVPAPIPFLGSKPFSHANAALRARGKPEIDWSLT